MKTNPRINSLDPFPKPRFYTAEFPTLSNFLHRWARFVIYFPTYSPQKSRTHILFVYLRGSIWLLMSEPRCLSLYLKICNSRLLFASDECANQNKVCEPWTSHPTMQAQRRIQGASSHAALIRMALTRKLYNARWCCTNTTKEWISLLPSLA